MLVKVEDQTQEIEKLIYIYQTMAVIGRLHRD